MTQTDLVTEEIVIVGSRYGDFTDVLKPYYEKGKPIEPEDIKTLLGSNVVYLQPVHNSDDSYAVGVFTTTEKRLGFVWKDQSPSLRELMSVNNKRYYKAHIKRINTKYGLMMAEVCLPDRLTDKVCRGIGIDEDWAKNIPETMTSITQQSLSLGFALLCDELPEAEVWNESLENRLANLKRNLPSDLSAQHIRESLELYEKMRRSDIKEVRESCDNMLDAYVSRGSEKNMKLWANQWLPGFFQDAADYDLLGLFEAANYTLERVEELLERAPANLFYLYKYNRERFAYHLYYSALPQNIYNRLLTLLAVREAMLNKKVGEGSIEGLTKEMLARAIENCQRYFWANSAYAVLYCICRDDYTMMISHADFENLVRTLPYKKDVRNCPAGTIANAFSDNPIFNEHIDDWDKFNPMKRIIKLRDALRKEMKLYESYMKVI